MARIQTSLNTSYKFNTTQTPSTKSRKSFVPHTS